MQPDLQAAISAIPAFATLPHESREALAGLCSVRRYAPDDFIVMYGEVGDALYLVAEGQVEVFTHNNAGKEITLELIDVGGVFGEVALFNGETRTANVKAQGAAALVRVESKNVSDVLSLCPALRDALLSGMAKRLRISGDNLRHLTTFDINTMKEQQLTTFDRVCAWIVDVLAGVPFLLILSMAFVFWIIVKPFHDSQLNDLDLALGAVSTLITLLVLLGQHRQEKSAAVADAEESLAIRQAAKELQYLHEKIDAALSRAPVPRSSDRND